MSTQLKRRRRSSISSAVRKGGSCAPASSIEPAVSATGLALLLLPLLCVVFDSSFFVDYAEPSSVYDNNIYHEECLRCNACGVNLTGPSQKRARRFKNQIFCDLHFADVALMESSDFMQQLRSFKPQSLGCAVARRKSSTTLIFPLPPQACSGSLSIRSSLSTLLVVNYEKKKLVEALALLY